MKNILLYKSMKECKKVEGVAADERCAKTPAPSPFYRKSLLFSVFGFLFALFFFLMDRSLYVYDEGLVLTGAWRVYLGDWPHRDFYANYGPGQFFTLAWLYKVFGAKVLVERIYDLTLRVLIVFVAYLSLSRYCSPRPALFGASLCALYLLGLSFHGYPVFPALLLSLGALILMLDYTDNPQSTPKLVGAGLFTGFAALYRYDLGFFAYISLLIALYASDALTTGTCSIDRGRLRNLMLLSLGAFVPVAIILILHWDKGALSDFMHDIIIFPAKHYAATRSLPFPKLTFGRTFGINNVDIYLPVVLVFLAFTHIFWPNGWWVIIRKKRKLRWSINTPPIMALSLMVLAFYVKGVVRVSVIHLIGSIIPAIMLAVVLLKQSRSSFVRRGVCLVLALFLICGIRLAVNKLVGESVFKEILRQSESPMLSLSQDAGRMMYEDGSPGKYFFVESQREAALQFIKARSAPMDFFYSGLTMHDKVIINDSAVYFLLGLRPATKWHHFDPALQNSAPIQAEIIRDLQRNKPALMMLDASWQGMDEPNESSKHSGVVELDQFIINNYLPFKSFGKISVWQKIEK